MNVLSPVENFNNSKLFFSRKEFIQILNFYSLGVSHGNWRDYAISSNKKEVSFYMFKHTLAQADCILTKKTKNRKITIYNLEINKNLKTKFKKYYSFSDLMINLRRVDLKIL